MLASWEFSIPGSQIDNEKVFSAAWIVSKDLRNIIGTQNIDTIMQVYQNFPNDTLGKDTYPGLHDISSYQTKTIHSNDAFRR